VNLLSLFSCPQLNPSVSRLRLTFGINDYHPRCFWIIPVILREFPMTELLKLFNLSGATYDSRSQLTGYRVQRAPPGLLPSPEITFRER